MPRLFPIDSTSPTAAASAAISTIRLPPANPDTGRIDSRISLKMVIMTKTHPLPPIVLVTTMSFQATTWTTRKAKPLEAIPPMTADPFFTLSASKHSTKIRDHTSVMETYRTTTR